MADVFHAYDIRGIYPDDLTDELAYKVGRALVEHFDPVTIVVGHDHRTSSPELHRALIEGITDQGADVIDIGFCSSPELYHANVTKQLLGVMITASHNPKEYNGIKVNNYDGRMINYAGGLKDIEALVTKDDFGEVNQKGKTKKEPHHEAYINHLRKHLHPLKRPLKVVIDAGNGVAGPTVQTLLASVPGLSIIPLFFEPDGEYPNHPANPVELDNVVELSEKVRETGADFGAAFDGDADRCIFLDERGVPISPDIFFCAAIEQENQLQPEGTYYIDLWFTRAARELLEKFGCSYEILPLGAANLREKMVLDGGIAASETSGHVMFAENNNQDDGFFVLIKALNYLSDSSKTMSALIAPYQTYAGDKQNFTVDDPDAVLDKIRETFSDGEIEELDGISVSYPCWWFNVRKSNTEPLVRLRVEAETKKALEEKKKLLKIFLR
ncbi:MAG: phosphomannomutase/phosphoglucomutase [Nanoarchaeota archaeon]